MSDVTRILSAIEQGDPHPAARLLPLVYDELPPIARRKAVPCRKGGLYYAKVRSKPVISLPEHPVGFRLHNSR